VPEETRKTKNREIHFPVPMKKFQTGFSGIRLEWGEEDVDWISPVMMNGKWFVTNTVGKRSGWKETGGSSK
jgi:hypothetical protein